MINVVCIALLWIKKKAFDSINRNALWFKLIKDNICGKFLKVVRGIYDQVKSCVKNCNNYSDFFEIAAGLKQGERLSPILFSLYINDLEQHFKDNVGGGIKLFDVCFTLLLFADDMLICGQSPKELQDNLDQLSDYCDKWGLNVNTEKTKIVVFRKRGKLRQYENWQYKGKSIEIVDEFNYLGILFRYTGSFIKHRQFVHDKALKALNMLMYKLRQREVTPKIALQLFDAFVLPIINYGSAIWGFGIHREIETIHLKFCKFILGVKRNASSVGVYGELGRYPLYVNRYSNMIKYWFKIITSENPLIITVYNSSLEDCYRGKVNWVTNIKSMLDRYGLGYIFNNPTKDNIPLIKKRIADDFIQKWHSDLRTSEMLILYKELKKEFAYERYLDYVIPKKKKMNYTKIRISNHNLHVQTGRYTRPITERRERKCLLCDENDIEDEFHFIFKCELYKDIREIYIKRYYRNRPSMFKFLQLLSSSQVNVINLCKFIHRAMEMRNRSIRNVQ